MTEFEEWGEQIESQNLYLKHYQLVTCASIVILMQLGFTFLEVGSVRVQFTKSILMKNMMDMIFSALVYFSIGFGFAFGNGTPTGGFMGTSNFFLVSNENVSDIHHSPAGWMYHWSFCATSATIVAGAIAERTQFVAYGVYSIVGSSVLYPVISHWIWSDTGWASRANPESVISPVLDDAGGIAVHTSAGICSLVACYFVGPRQHRLDSKGNLVSDLPRQNQAFIVFGMLVLWFSWYAFNAGTAILEAGNHESLMGNIAAYTTVCTASSGALYLVLHMLLRKKLPEPSDLCNGILGGLVCSTSGCSVIQPYYGSSFIILFFLAGSSFMILLFLVGSSFMILLFFVGSSFMIISFFVGSSFMILLFFVGSSFIILSFIPFLLGGIVVMVPYFPLIANSIVFTFSQPQIKKISLQSHCNFTTISQQSQYNLNTISQPGIIIGSVGGAVVMAISKLLTKLKIDDVVDAVAVHLGCGVWSAISAPLFSDTHHNTNSG
ncbi:hypothetical protein ACHWQZ_G001363 [Mnemiopsis leidyi]